MKAKNFNREKSVNFIMTEGGKRREGILLLLEDTNMPLSGTELARHFNVSRQVSFRILPFAGRGPEDPFYLQRICS